MVEEVISNVPIFPDLAGKVAVVTGGSKGIGAATCRALVANGVSVAVVARDRTGIDRVVAPLVEAGGRVIGISADATSYDSIEQMRHHVEDELGPTDILIPFAGGFRRATAITEITEEEWRDVIDANLTSTFLTCKSFLSGMIERRRGAIVTMASNAGRLLDVTVTASYAASKAGIVMFTRHVARELGQYSVRVNCVAPATTMTERVERIMSPERIQHMVELAPLKRIGVPDDVAFGVLYLASDAASWITGITLDVTGGRIML